MDFAKLHGENFLRYINFDLSRKIHNIVREKIFFLAHWLTLVDACVNFGNSKKMAMKTAPNKLNETFIHGGNMDLFT